jgi:class 3 adenylate cyclase
MKLAHVLFMDIVGYSILPTDQQSRIVKTLQEVVRGTAEVTRAQASNQLISLATGDGMALVFFNDPMAPVQCALEISKALKGHPEIKLRMGVHTGPVNEIVDVNERLNVAGAGINMAQRVMDSGDAGHILLSRRVAEDLGQYSSWQPFLHDLKEVEVKHGVRVHVFNLYTGEVGNKELPEKVRKRKKRVVTLPVLGGIAALIAIVSIITLVLRFRSESSSAPPLKPESAFAGLLQQKVDAWTEGVFQAQAADGGMRAVTSGAQSRTQAWTTAQSMAAVFTTDKDLSPHVAQIRNSFEYIRKLRRTTPYEGWNLYGNNNPFTITEISGWVTIAHIRSLEAKTQVWSEKERGELLQQIVRDLDEMAHRQDPNGGFRPIAEQGPDFVRTYSTIISLWTLVEARQSAAVNQRIGSTHDDQMRRAISWLLQTYRAGQGWVQNPTRTGQKDRFEQVIGDAHCRQRQQQHSRCGRGVSRQRVHGRGLNVSLVSLVPGGTHGNLT